MTIATYEDAVRYLEGLKLHGIRPGLDAINALLKRLSISQTYPIVHIAGTKGKGTTASVISTLLQKEGFKVGTYLSPHLWDLRERILVDCKMVDIDLFLTAVKEVSRAIEQCNYKITYFEALTAIALDVFSYTGVDYGVIEVGMGGRLDATNVLKHKDYCIITPIELEHQQYLGNTVTAIASEKAAIINSPGIKAVYTSNTSLDVLKQIVSRCKQYDLSLRLVWEYEGRNITIGYPKLTLYTVKNLKVTWQGTKGSIYFDDGQCVNISLPLVGKKFAINTGLAISVVRDIVPNIAHTDCSIPTLYDVIPGRGHTVTKGNVRYILDGAHTPGSISALGETLRILCSDGCVWVVGILNDKDYPAILRSVSEFADYVVLTESSSERAIDTETLHHEIIKYMDDAKIFVSNGVEEGIEIAKNICDDRPIVITGSFTVVAEAYIALGLRKIQNPLKQSRVTQ